MLSQAKSVYIIAVLLSICVAFTSITNAPLNIKSARHQEKGLMVQGNTGPPQKEWVTLAAMSFTQYIPKFENPSQKLSL